MKAALVGTIGLVLATSAFAQAPVEPTPPPAAEATSTAPQLTPEQEEQEYARKAQEFYDSLDKKTGPIPLAGGKVLLQVPPGYYYLDPADLKRVIVDVWGNPPGADEGVEGMLFAAGANPAASDSWGAVLEFADDGYVSDKDAQTTDYTKLLQDMQKQTEDQNADRVKSGFPAMQLVKWAEPPSYDAATHKMYWAEDLHVGDANIDTLNYRIRLLGREGVFVVNFIAGMDQLAQVKSEADGVMAIPTFTQGHTYADHAEGDRMAEYGIAGLVAGGLGLAAAQKFGLFALILAFGKKFLVLIIAAFAGGFTWIKSLFSGKKAVVDDAAPEPAKEEPPRSV